MSSVADILQELDDHGFEDTSTARKTAMINDSYFEILTLEAWPFLEDDSTVTALSSTTALANVPADFSKVLVLKDETDDYVYIPERLDTVKKSFEISGAQPYVYYFIGNTIHVYPQADEDTSLRLYYIKAPNELTGAGTSADSYAGSSAESAILLPVRHHRLLVLGALVRLYSMEDDPELAAVFDFHFDRKLERMREDVWKRQYDRPDRIHVVDDDDLFGYGNL